MNDRQSLDGVFIIDKPAGWTSHDVVARVRKILNTRRVGHTGTLDPFATGVLVVCVNRATRLVQFLTVDDKEYLATMRVGFATDTGDLTGQPISPVSDARQLTTEMVAEALALFRGRIKQTPPMFSAKKVGGVKLYQMARRGEEIERAPIEVEIKELELCDPPDLFPSGEVKTLTRDFHFRVVCSSGTYIRKLAEDIGEWLGYGAHLTALRRTRAGSCYLNRAVTLEELAESAEAGGIEQMIIPMAEAVALDELRVSEVEAGEIVHGRSIRRQGNWLNGTRAKLCDHNRRLVAIAEYNAHEELWQPRIVLCRE
jgi:tRNA pseudouridine55 synthase